MPGGTVSVLISDSHAFIFVHMRKVASTSMQSILRPLCLEPPVGRLAHLKSRARLEWDYRRYLFRIHDDILAAKRRMPAEKFQRYFKFAFVRNPWSRLVSEYAYILSQPGHGRHARVVRLGCFSEFIRMQIPRREAYQLNMLCDSSGGLLTDFVGKLENLQADWQAVCERIGIRCELLPPRNVTQHDDYRKYFSDADVQLVARHWAREIDLFEYSFDAG
jgi:Sulfotransferase family